VDALIEKANSGTDQNQRRRITAPPPKAGLNDAPWIFLYNRSTRT